MCTIFYDGEIKPGERWDNRLKDELHRATIFVLLVSADFLNSDYVNNVELPKILEKEKLDEARVLPVILKKCLWKYSEISELQVIMDGGKPIAQTGGFGEAADAIAKVVAEYNQAVKDELATIELKDGRAEIRQLKDIEDYLSGSLGGKKRRNIGNFGKPDKQSVLNASRLSGINIGSSTVGGGLNSRGYRRPSFPKDNIQGAGVVTVYICVNKHGEVISAEYVVAGSTTTNSKLKMIAIENAKKYRFDKSDVDKQCGTIRYNFNLK